jgi:glutaredoxin
MGRITVYVKDNCKFCDIILSVLRVAIQNTLRQIVAFAESEYGVVGIEFCIINVTHDYARANQCKALSKQQTVPQIFFGSTHVGNCKQTQTILKSGVLKTKLYCLAYQPHGEFPPEPVAAIVKVTKDIACASLLAPQQLLAIARSGIRTVISLVHDDEPGFNADEGGLLKRLGVVFLHIPPPHAPHIPTGMLEGSARAWYRFASPTLTAIASTHCPPPGLYGFSLSRKESIDKDDTIQAPSTHSDTDLSVVSDDGLSMQSWGSASSGYRIRGRGASGRPKLPDAFRSSPSGAAALPPRPRVHQRPPCAFSALRKMWENCVGASKLAAVQHVGSTLDALPEVAETGTEYAEPRSPDCGRVSPPSYACPSASSGMVNDCHLSAPPLSAEEDACGVHEENNNNSINSSPCEVEVTPCPELALTSNATAPCSRTSAARRSSITSERGSVVSAFSDDYGLSDDDVHSFDVRDEDIGGRDPADFTYTREWLASVEDAVRANYHIYQCNFQVDTQAYVQCVAGENGGKAHPYTLQDRCSCMCRRTYTSCTAAVGVCPTSAQMGEGSGV